MFLSANLSPNPLAALAAVLPAFFGRPFDYRHHLHPTVANENNHKGPAANATTIARLRAEPAVVAAERVYARAQAHLAERLRTCAPAARRDARGVTFT